MNGWGKKYNDTLTLRSVQILDYVFIFIKRFCCVYKDMQEKGMKRG